MQIDIVWGTLGEWVSGIGTLFAAFVALHLGYRKPRETLNWSCQLQRSATDEMTLLLTVRNTGIVDSWITEAKLDQRGVVLDPFHPPLPLRLAPGEQSHLRFLIGGMVPRVNKPPALHFRTGRGKTYKVAIEANTAKQINA